MEEVLHPPEHVLRQAEEPLSLLRFQGGRQTDSVRVRRADPLQVRQLPSSGGILLASTVFCLNVMTRLHDPAGCRDELTQLSRQILAEYLFDYILGFSKRKENSFPDKD